MGDTWHLDELFVRIQGRQQYLWRAVDEDGDTIDILVQSRRNRQAALRFFRGGACLFDVNLTMPYELEPGFLVTQPPALIRVDHLSDILRPSVVSQK